MAIVITIAILYVATDTFKSNSELFAKYFAQNEELLSILENTNIEEQKKFKKTNNYTSNGELLVSIQEGTNTQEIKATTASRHDSSTNRTYSEMILKNGETDLIKMSYINSGDVYAIKYEDVLANYIGIRNSDLKTFAKNMGMSDSDISSIPDTIDFSVLDNITEFTDEQKQHIKDTYFPIILENIEKSKYTKISKSQISVDGVSYVTKAYDVAIDGNTLKQIVTACLTTLKNDNTTLIMISSKLSSLNLGNDFTDITKLSQMIEKSIEQVQNSETNESTMKITIYEYKGTTIRTMIEIPDIIKMTIDKLGQENNKKAIITVERNETTTSNNVIAENNNTIVTSQIILEQMITNSETLNEITIIPDMKNSMQKVMMSTSIGKVLNGVINNSSNISITNSTDGINSQTIDTSYTQAIQAVAQVEEILELKNSNTIIVNNYSKEQLVPFLENLGNQVMQIVPSKLVQLGINLGINQNTNTGTSMNTDMNIGVSINANTVTDNIENLTKAISIVGTSGLTIANANGLNIQNIVVVGFVETVYYSYNVQMNALKAVENAQQQQTQAREEYNQFAANTQAYLDDYINQIGQ